MKLSRKIAYDVIESPLGRLCIFQSEQGLCGIYFGEESVVMAQARRELGDGLSDETPLARDPSFCRVASTQLREYFYEGRRCFDVVLDVQGTPFQRAVWSALQKIPYGETRAYGDIAMAINNPKAVRAVGQANRKNQIPIVVPCHRVIGKDGSLVGYDGHHTDRKDWLLRFEGVY